MKEVKESTMIGYLKSYEVESVRVEETKITAELKSGETVYTYVNSAVDMSFIYEDYIMPQVKDGGLKLSSPAPTKESIWISLLPTLIMVGLMVFLFWFIMQQQGAVARPCPLAKAGPSFRKATRKRSPLMMWPA